MDAFAKLMTQCCSEQIVLKGDTGWKVDQSNLHEIQLNLKIYVIFSFLLIYTVPFQSMGSARFFFKKKLILLDSKDAFNL